MQTQTGSQNGTRIKGCPITKSFPDAIQWAKRCGWVIASTRKARDAFREKGEREGIRNVPPTVHPVYITGDVFAYPGVGDRFGEVLSEESITYPRVLLELPIPKGFRREQGLLVVRTGDYELREDRDRRVIEVDERKVELLEGFPMQEGGYKEHPVYGIPFEELVDVEDPEAVVLSRRTESGRIGPAVFDLRKPNQVDLVLSPFLNFGLLIEEAMS